MKSKTLAIFTIIALCLSLATVLAPPLASPAQAMETLHENVGPPTFIQNGNVRPITLQPGDEIIQFTRPNLVVGTNPRANFFTVGRASCVNTGDLIGTVTSDIYTMLVTWDELPPGTWKGYSINTGTFDDGYGNTVSAITVSDLDWTGGPSPNSSGYTVTTSGTGTFSGQVGIGTMSGDTNGWSTVTARRYSNSEVSGPYAMSATGTSINGNSRDLGGSTGPDPSDEFLQLSRANIIIPKGNPAGYIEGGSSSASITSGILTGTMTQTYNHIFIPGTTPPYQGLTIAKVIGSNASGTISGVGIYDYLGISGGSGSSYGYMFALKENGTGAYADKDFYGTVSITDTGGTWTSNGNLYIMEPSAAGSTVSGTFTVTNGTISGTYNTSPPYETLTGSGTGTFSFGGDISGTSTFEGTYDASDQSMRGTNIPAPCTLTIGGVTHTAMIYGKSTTTNFVIGPPGHPNPSPVTFDMLISGDIWTTDGSNIFVHVTVSGSGNATESWPALGQWQMTGFSVSGTWTGTAQNFEAAPQVSDVTPGSGTVTLSGALGTVAQLNYETTGSGTILLAQYQGNPGGNPVKTPLGKYIEVDTSIINPEITWPVQLRVYYTDAEVAAAGLNENSLRMYRWDGSSWTLVAESGVDTTQNYIWANLYSFSGYGPMGDPLGGGGFAPVPVSPNIYIGIATALGAGILAYFIRRKLIYQR